MKTVRTALKCQNVMCTKYVVKHNLVLDGMLIY